jgi:hypothetical protein
VPCSRQFWSSMVRAGQKKTYPRDNPEMLARRDELWFRALLLCFGDPFLVDRLSEYLHLCDHLSNRQSRAIVPIGPFERDQCGNEQGAI